MQKKVEYDVLNSVTGVLWGTLYFGEWGWRSGQASWRRRTDLEGQVRRGRQEIRREERGWLRP